jgi:hypothetical protein
MFNLINILKLDNIKENLAFKRKITKLIKYFFLITIFFFKNFYYYFSFIF